MTSCKESLEENICPICMYVLIQPVTMPCSHELCLPCFKQNVEEANFCCPMCRMRISTWTRKASRNKTLVNQERWQEIMRLFPEHVNKRLNGEDDDDELGVLPVNIRLAKPGEIRTEYEEQLRKLRQEYAEQRRLEQEASEQLIKQLQEQEKKKQQEMENLEKQDEELAKELSEIMNKADLLSPYSTRSGSGTSESGSIRSFIESMKSNNQVSGSPYPYPCLTPTANGKICVDKDRALLLEQTFKKKAENEKRLLTTQDLLNLETQYKLHGKRCNSKASATAVAGSLDEESRTDSTHSLSSLGQNSSLSQDEILQQMSEQLDLGTSLADSPDCMIVEPKRVPEKMALKLNLKDNRSSSTCTESSKNSTDMLEVDTPSVGHNHKKLTLQTNRSSSSQSNDSISPELAHFRPIRACPLTPPRQLSSGRVVEPVLIRTTPRNLNKSFSTEERSLSDIDASSPIMQKCLEQLEVERKDKVVKMSKSTTTRSELQDNENKNPHPSSPENAKKLMVHGMNNLIGSRSTEFKDISNSPLPKRKYEAVETEMDVSPKRKKLIIPLEPDLNDNDDVFEILPFDLKLKTASPVSNKDANEDSRSKSVSRSKKKVKNKATSCSTSSKDGVQSAITNWTMKQEINLPHINNSDKVPSKQKEISKTHNHTKETHDNMKKDKRNTIDSYFARSCEKKPRLRSREKIRQPRYPEYDYIDISPKKRKVDTELSNSGSVPKLSFNSEDSDSEHSESASESEEDSNLGRRNQKPRKTHDSDVYEGSCSGISRNKRKTEMLKKPKRLKNAPGRSRGGRKTNKSVNKHGGSDCKRTVEDFFKVGTRNANKTDSNTGEMDGIIYSKCGTGIVSQEEQDRLLALELQKQFDFEQKYHLNAVRLKGSNESYLLRHQRKAVQSE